VVIGVSKLEVMSNLCTKICQYENVILYSKGPIINPQKYYVGLKMKLFKLRKVTTTT
jgi:hypothetical protein